MVSSLAPGRLAGLGWLKMTSYLLFVRAMHAAQRLIDF